MSPQQDTVIDDDEETCPLCIEEFDLQDRNFKPCPCGYQICQFCFNSLKTTYDKSTCPNCRRPYDESTIQYKIPTAEELKVDQMNKNKKLAAAKRRENEKREVENSSRRNLAGVRVKQQNLVYVIGLDPTKKDESTLLETLRGRDYFGQYGPIEKIVVSKAKPGAANQGIGVYVTYKNKEDAALCIDCVDGSHNGDRILRAQFGTTKYCSAFLRGETCTNKNCSFLHETGEDGQHATLQNEPIEPKKNVVHPLPTRSQTTPQPPAVPQITARQDTRDESSSRTASTDASALPPSAGWANAPVAKARRASMARSTPSPQLMHAILNVQKPETSKGAEPPVPPPPVEAAPSPSPPKSPTPPPPSRTSPPDPISEIFDAIRDSVTNVNCAFNYDDSFLSPETRAEIEEMPPMYDPYGGAKRRIMADKEAEARAKAEAESRARSEAQSRSTAEDAPAEDTMATGSLALGGEPEDDPRTASARGAIGRPPPGVRPAGAPSDQLASADRGGSGLTPPPQRPRAVFASGDPSQSGSFSQPPAQNTAFEMSDFDRRGPQYSQAQYDQISSHQRHGSRYFNNEPKSGAPRFSGHQQQFYAGGTQGPPPGLPTAGTPPVSGGGMFAHGQGFTSSGFGAGKENRDDARIRSATNAGGDIKLNASNFPPLPSQDEMSLAFESRPPSVRGVSSVTSRPGPTRLFSHLDRAATPQIPPGFDAPPVPLVPPPGLSEPSTRPLATFPAPPTITPITTAVRPAVPPVAATPRVHASEPPLAAHGSTLPPTDAAQGVGQTSLPDTTEATVNVPFGPVAPALPPEEPVSEGIAFAADGNDGRQETDDPFPPLPGGPRAKPAPKSKKEERAPAAGPAGARKPTASTPHSPEPVVAASNVTSAGVVAPPDPPASGAATPVTPAATATEGKTPRTLRLTAEMIEKARKSEPPAPASAMTERSAAFPPLTQIRQTSRQASISTSRPSTPAVSERYMSQEVSRAGSPPPSVGAGPSVRPKTKNQLKKERRDKAKKPEEESEPGSAPVPTPGPVEVVGPIVARQKKQKKSKTVSKPPETVPVPARSVTNASEAKSTRQEDRKRAEGESRRTQERSSVKKTTEAAPVQPKPKPPEPPRDNPRPVYFLKYLYDDAEAILADRGERFRGLIDKNMTSVTTLLSEMIADGELSKDHPWFTPPSLTSPAYKLPPDTRKGQEYLDAHGYGGNDAFGYVYLPQKEKKALHRGSSVKVADGGARSGDLLKRCLITSHGWVVRHLNEEESDHLLDLQDRQSFYGDEYGKLGTMDGITALEPNDFINLDGGLQEITRSGDQHGVCWVHDADGAVDTAGDDEEGSRMEGMSEDEEVLGIDWTGMTIPGGWEPKPMAKTAKTAGQRSLNVAATSGQRSQTPSLRDMDVEALHRRIHEKQREIESSRKEADRAEKTLNKKARDLARWRDSLFKGAGAAPRA